MHAIEAVGVSKRYGRHDALTGIDLIVPQGSIFGLLGPNGAGKSTLMRCMLGLERPTAGLVRLFGEDISERRCAALARVGTAIDEAGPYAHLSGRSALRVTAVLRGLLAAEIDRVLDVVGLADAADRRVGDYSLGMRRRLSLGRALLGEPALLLLDEPTNGLDPAGAATILSVIRALPSVGTTVLLSSHLLHEVEATADAVAFLSKGRIAGHGRMAEVTFGEPTITIGVDDQERALVIAKGAGRSVGRTGSDGIEVAFASKAVSAEHTARLVADLVAASIAVHSVVPASRTLADAYNEAQAAA